MDAPDLRKLLGGFSPRITSYESGGCCDKDVLDIICDAFVDLVAPVQRFLQAFLLLIKGHLDTLQLGTNRLDLK